jgi:hypothetical protein
MSLQVKPPWLVNGSPSFLEWFFTSPASLKIFGWSAPLEAPPAFLLLCVGLLIWSLRWVARDAQARGRNGSTAAFFVFFCFWPWSLLFWRWVRPPLLLVAPPAPVSSLSDGSSNDPFPPGSTPIPPHPSLS